MKINKVTRIRVSLEEVRACLADYQRDMIGDLVSTLHGDTPVANEDVRELVFNAFSQNEKFDEALEKAGVHILATPTTGNGWASLVEEFPMLGLGSAAEAIESVDTEKGDVLEVYLDGVLLNSKRILNNY